MLGQSKSERDAVLVFLLLQREDGRTGFVLPGLSVCNKAFLFLMGVSQSKLRKLGKRIELMREAGRVSASLGQHGNAGKTKPSAELVHAIKWIWSTAALGGERNPVTQKLHVFMFFCSDTLWTAYSAACRKEGVERMISRESFLDLVVKKRGADSFEYCRDIVWKRSVTQKMCGCCVVLLEDRALMLKSGVSSTSDEWIEWNSRRVAHWE